MQGVRYEWIEIVPPEADGIACVLEFEAGAVDMAINSTFRAKSGLNDASVWQGVSQREFMELFGNKPEELRRYKESLLDAAKKVRRMKVRIRREVRTG